MKKSIVEASKVLGAAFDGDFGARGILKEAAMTGEMPTWIQEAYATTDMLAAFNIATRERVESQYPKAERVWQKIAKRNLFDDFKEQKFREFTWDKGLIVDENAGARIVPGALARIPEGTEYPSFGFSTGENSFKLHKHGARFPFFWEMVVNDEWNFIEAIPDRMVEFSLQTEEVEAFTQLADENGPRAASFETVGTEKLTLDTLSAAKTLVRSRKVNGRAVRVPRFALVVPPAMEEYARRLLAISTLEHVEGVGTDTELRYTTSTANGDVELVVADVLVDIDQSANVDTTWYLVPAGGSDGTRDSILVNFLRRNERPDLRISGNTGSYLGGGAVPGLEGSLLNDDVEYRVRHVVTGGIHHNTGMYASKGNA